MLKLKKNEIKQSKLELNSILDNNNFFQNILLKFKEKDTTASVKMYDNKALSKKPLIIRENIAKEIADTLTRAEKFTKEVIFYHMYGQAGIGKNTLVKRAASLLKRKLMAIDLKALKDNYSKDWSNTFYDIISKNESSEDILCLDNFQMFFDKGYENKRDAFAVIEIVKQYFRTVFVLSDNKINDKEFEEKYFWFSENIPDLSSEENFKMWQRFMPAIKDMTDEKPEEIASKFSFTPKQIEGTIRFSKKEYLKNSEKKLSKEQFQKCAYSQVISTLGEKAKLITKKYTWDDMIIDSKTKLELQNACERVKYKYKVYDAWGLGDKHSYGHGLSMIFYGSPGTGKTMAAQVIASELGMDLYKVDTARVVSKYIGETEKNLREIFEEARKSNVILLFDEADSLFSKRTDIKDSHDRNANIEVSFLLQQLEDHDGITILTTNKDQNIDEAFNRRITFKISFSKPYLGVKGTDEYSENYELIKGLWEKFLNNGKIPLADDIDYDYLTTHFNVTGSDVRKAVTTAAFLACKEKSDKLCFKHILSALKTGLKKRKDDFGYEYHTFVDEIFKEK